MLMMYTLQCNIMDFMYVKYNFHNTQKNIKKYYDNIILIIYIKYHPLLLNSYIIKVVKLHHYTEYMENTHDKSHMKKKIILIMVATKPIICNAR